MLINIVNVTNSLLQMIGCILDLLQLPGPILIDGCPANSVHLSQNLEAYILKQFIGNEKRS